MAAAACICALLLAGQSEAHRLRGTETWVHVAQPGIELSFTVSDKETAQALGLSDNYATWASAWRVETNGKPCTLAGQPQVRTGAHGHLRLGWRYRCNGTPERLVLTPTFLGAARRGDAHMARILIGDRLAPFDLAARPEPIVLDVGALLRGWDTQLSASFLGSEALEQRAGP